MRNLPGVKPTILVAVAAISLGANTAINLIVQVLSKPGQITDLHNFVSLTITGIGKTLAASNQKNGERKSEKQGVTHDSIKATFLRDW